jgi:putative colanic acid biosynthesis acetyltransferase WcaF
MIGPGTIVYNQARITIGERAVVSQRSHLCAGSHAVNDPNFQLITRPISIGDQAWIASEAFVGPGVTVGEGAVLAARGVAFRDLDPWSIYNGNPAAFLKKRSFA